MMLSMLTRFKISFAIAILHKYCVQKYDGSKQTPLSQCPSGAFSLGGNKDLYKNLNGDKNILFPAQNFQWEWFGVHFFHSISNGDKFIGQFPSGVEILGHFFHWGRFLGQFFQWGEAPTGSVTQGYKKKRHLI